MKIQQAIASLKLSESVISEYVNDHYSLRCGVDIICYLLERWEDQCVIDIEDIHVLEAAQLILHRHFEIQGPYPTCVKDLEKDLADALINFDYIIFELSNRSHA